MLFLTGSEDIESLRTRPRVITGVTREWIEQLGVLAADLEEPVAAAVEAARVPWWR